MLHFDVVSGWGQPAPRGSLPAAGPAPGRTITRPRTARHDDHSTRPGDSSGLPLLTIWLSI
jgi:hypothetical protein